LVHFAVTTFCYNERRMAGEVRNLLNRDGRYFARVTVPKDLREILGKRELRSSLGPDRRDALRKLPVAVAKLLDAIAGARRVMKLGRPPQRRLTLVELAHLHYDELLQEDEVARNGPEELIGVTVPAMNAVFADGRRKALARVVSGEAQEDEISALLGVYLEIFQARGMINAPRGSVEWRKLARFIAGVQIEAQTRSVERDVGYYGGTPSFPPLTRPRPADLHVRLMSWECASG
jgi:hypothetical protein